MCYMVHALHFSWKNIHNAIFFPLNSIAGNIALIKPIFRLVTYTVTASQHENAIIPTRGEVMFVCAFFLQYYFRLSITYSKARLLVHIVLPIRPFVPGVSSPHCLTRNHIHLSLTPPLPPPSPPLPHFPHFPPSRAAFVFILRQTLLHF